MAAKPRREGDGAALRRLLQKQMHAVEGLLSSHQEQIASFFEDSKDAGAWRAQPNDLVRPVGYREPPPNVNEYFVEEVPNLPGDVPQVCYVEDWDQGPAQKKPIESDRWVTQESPTCIPESGQDKEDKEGKEGFLSEMLKGFNNAGKEEDKPENRRAFFIPTTKEEMKKLMNHQHLQQVEYDVRNFYWKEGYAQRIARSYLFEFATYAMIGLNTIWLGIETDGNKADVLTKAPLYIQVCEHLFCVYFTFEIFIRFAAFEKKSNCLRDAWFVLVLLMITETWLLTLIITAMGSQPLRNLSVLRTFRIVRLSKTSRMLRLMRACPELMILIKGIWIASRSVFFVVCLLLILIYCFAIAFTQLMRDTEMQDDFRGVGKSMYTLTLEGIFADLSPLVTAVGDVYPLYAVLMFAFIGITTLTVMNLLVGVLVQVVDVVAAVENERIDIRYVKAALMSMITSWEYDDEGNRGLSREEFLKLLITPQCCRLLIKIDVDTMDLIGLVDSILFKTERKVVAFGEIMEFMLQLRRTNVAKVRDVVDLRLQSISKLEYITTVLDRDGSDNNVGKNKHVDDLAEADPYALEVV